MIVLVLLRKELHASKNRKLISLFLDSNSRLSGHIIVLSCLTYKVLRIFLRSLSTLILPSVFSPVSFFLPKGGVLSLFKNEPLLRSFLRSIPTAVGHNWAANWTLQYYDTSFEPDSNPPAFSATSFPKTTLFLLPLCMLLQLFTGLSHTGCYNYSFLSHFPENHFFFLGFAPQKQNCPPKMITGPKVLLICSLLCIFPPPVLSSIISASSCALSFFLFLYHCLKCPLHWTVELYRLFSRTVSAERKLLTAYGHTDIH